MRLLSRVSLSLTVLCLLAVPALQAQPTLDEEFLKIAGEVPGFGGFFYDAEGVANVWLVDLAQATAFRLEGAPVRFLPAQYDFRELAGYRDELAKLMSRRDAVLLDVDEARNRVRFGVDVATGAAGIAAFEDALAGTSVPRDAVVVEAVEPFHHAVTLRQRIRPVPGGVQIAFGGFLCTMGFGATRGGVVGYVTNSHCTNVQGGVEGTVHYQHSNAAGNRIGVETVDPAYGAIAGCPAGRRCRWSDSSFGRYDAAADRQFARIARTTGLGSITIDDPFPRFTIVGTVANPTTGITLNKMGRTTGWSRGTVAFTCATINVSGSTITQICQSGVNAAVGGGDSGSPVFSASTSDGSTNANLYGILWGGNTSGTQFVFSPWSGITRAAELGALAAF